MLIQYKALLVILIGSCSLNGKADGSEGENVSIQDGVIRYTYPNDIKSSISIIFEKREPLLHQEEWVIIACITKTPFSSYDFSTTITSNRVRINDALSRSVDAFQRMKPNACIPHIYCSNFITSETLTTFQKWIIPAKNGKDNLSRSKFLQEKLRSYSFDPLRNDLNSILLNHGYKVASTEYAVEPGIILVEDTDAFIKYLALNHSLYYIELERLE